ncbi:MAG: zinc-binding dehydrogenase [Hungatella sp.]|nr:zinc-binding dehydrogenase [Hungatella sp.]
MKAFVLKEPGVVGWAQVPRPKVTPFGAILEPVAVAPCSSDVHTVFGGGSKKAPNLVLGHECVARVVETGEYVEDFKSGEVVAVPAITPDWRARGIQDHNFKHASAPFSGHQLGRSQPGVFAEQFLIPDADTTLAKIPEGVSVKQALMCVDVVTTGFTGAEYGNIKFGDTVVVMGIGPIGLMAVAGAAMKGAARILAVGTRPVCVKQALKLGAGEVLSYKDGDIVEQVMERTGGMGADCVIVCGGDDQVFAQAIDMVRYGVGTVSNINYFGGTGFLPFPKFSGGRGMAGKTIHTELAEGGRVRIERILRMVQFGRIHPEELVTHELKGFDNIEKALYLMRDKPKDLIKVMVTL